LRVFPDFQDLGKIRNVRNPWVFARFYKRSDLIPPQFGDLVRKILDFERDFRPEKDFENLI
jgi:hypothetical protein